MFDQTPVTSTITPIKPLAKKNVVDIPSTSTISTPLLNLDQFKNLDDSFTAASIPSMVMEFGDKGAADPLSIDDSISDNPSTPLESTPIKPIKIVPPNPKPQSRLTRSKASAETSTPLVCTFYSCSILFFVFFLIPCLIQKNAKPSTSRTTSASSTVSASATKDKQNIPQPTNNNNNNNSNIIIVNSNDKNNNNNGNNLINNSNVQILGSRMLLGLLKKIAKAYHLLSQYKCQEAIKSFEKLPYSQYQSGWVLTMIGKAHMELVEYTKVCFLLLYSNLDQSLIFFL